MNSYHNLMHSPVAAKCLEATRAAGETVLDVGGGVCPWYAATHVIDLKPFDADRLAQTAWGGQGPRPWLPTAYTQADICDGPWPFPDHAFDLGYAGGVLEDLRDPLFAVREMQRVCRRVLVECPSRLCEQTRGIEHQRWTGFWHHRWMVSDQNHTLCFQRKTALLLLPGCHHTLQPWQCADLDTLVFSFVATCPFPIREVSFWSEVEEQRDLREFVARSRLVKRTRTGWRPIVYRLRQKFLGRI